MKIIITSFFLLLSISLFGQVNCFIYPEKSPEREACELCDEAIKHQQGSKASQQIFDKSIAISPNFAWAYYEKSVPFLKRGFLHKGLQILNKAVELEPIEYLCYRAYWYWQYQNYDLCIKDLETYYELPNAYLQFTPGGGKDMKLILGLAYAKNNNYKKGIETLESCIATYKSEDDVGLSDYHTLGVLYLHTKQYDKAIEMMKKQFTINKDIPDSYYYLGLAYKAKSDFKEAKIQFNNALLKFQNGNYYSNPNAGFRAYLADVKAAIKSLDNI